MKTQSDRENSRHHQNNKKIIPPEEDNPVKKAAWAFALFLMIPAIATAGSEAPDPSITTNKEAIDLLQTNLNFVWTLIAACLVFFMQAGFAMVESGFTRAKSAVNIMMKNLMDFSMGSVAFWAIGFGIMFGSTKTGWFGTDGFFLSGWSGTESGDPWVLAFWMFQCVFAATAATIVSGAVAERTKFISYLIYSVVVCAFIYPVFGSWAWGSLLNGNGWLEGLGFIDFAGSTTTGDSSIAIIFVTTNLSAACGAIFAMFTSWIMFKKPDIGMSLNGALAGLVGITAGCANVSPTSAAVIGAISGVLVVLSVVVIDKIHIDDPVGAISVHGVCGAWGTLAAGLFNTGGTSVKIITTQLIGIGAAFVWSFGAAFILFKVIDMTIGLRISKEDEMMGVDIVEHGAHAYNDFQTLN